MLDVIFLTKLFHTFFTFHTSLKTISDNTTQLFSSCMCLVIVTVFHFFHECTMGLKKTLTEIKEI